MSEQLRGALLPAGLKPQVSQTLAEIYPVFWKVRIQIYHTEDDFAYFFYSLIRYCLFPLKECPFAGDPYNETYVYCSLKALGQQQA